MKDTELIWLLALVYGMMLVGGILVAWAYGYI